MIHYNVYHPRTSLEHVTKRVHYIFLSLHRTTFFPLVPLMICVFQDAGKLTALSSAWGSDIILPFSIRNLRWVIRCRAHNLLMIILIGVVKATEWISEDTSVPPVRSSVKDCPSKVTQPYHLKSSITSSRYSGSRMWRNFQRNLRLRKVILPAPWTRTRYWSFLPHQAIKRK